MNKCGVCVDDSIASTVSMKYTGDFNLYRATSLSTHIGAASGASLQAHLDSRWSSGQCDFQGNVCPPSQEVTCTVAPDRALHLTLEAGQCLRSLCGESLEQGYAASTKPRNL
eukprot:766389-Hanusia_phi.AAC.1